MAKNQNKIKFISLPKQLDVDEAISDKIEEVYGVCPYCGQSDEVLCCSYTDYMQMATSFHADPRFEDPVAREFFSKIKRSDFELEELRLNGKAPFFKTKMTKLYDWVRMLFYCPDCDCLWGSEKYPINLSSDTAVIQHIMEMHTQGYDSTALVALQNGFPTDLPNTRIPYPDPESIPEYQDDSVENQNTSQKSGTPSKLDNTTVAKDNIAGKSFSLSSVENELADIISVVLNEFSCDKRNVAGYHTHDQHEIAKHLHFISIQIVGCSQLKLLYRGVIGTFKYEAVYDMVEPEEYHIYIEEMYTYGDIYKESILRCRLDEWKDRDWHLTIHTLPATHRKIKTDKYIGVMA